MATHHHPRKRIIGIAVVFIAGLFLLVGFSIAIAQQGSGQVNRSIEQASPSGWGDEGTYEVGVEWENVFPDPAGNRDYWNVSCDGVYNWLSMAGWTPRFRWVNYDAYEKDFKLDSLGGWQSTYSDNVDLAMVCTHGSTAFDNKFQKDLSAVYFGSEKDDHYLSPGEAYISFGDQDLEYLAFDSCSVLADPSVVYWLSTFNGLHLMLGFSNNMHVDPYGDGWLWGFYMTLQGLSSTVTQGWFAAIDFNQPSWVCARVLAENLGNYNEHWWNTWPDPVVDSEKWIWDHCSYGIIYGRNSTEASQAISVPVVRILHRKVDENYVRNNIAPAFNLEGEISSNEWFYILGDTTGGITQTLLVDRATGSYSYHNWSELWTTPIVTPTLPESGRIANVLVNNWFSDSPRKGLPSASYRNAGYLFYPEGIYSQLLSETSTEDIQGQVTRQIPTDISMTYPRIISVTATTTVGTSLVNFPVFGPGARTVVYIGDMGEIIGAQGGSRNIQPMADQVTILDPAIVWKMFIDNPNLSIGEIPLMSDVVTHTVPTLGYYEMPYFVHQDELIPVYEFRSWFYQAGKLVAGDYPVYLPAASFYMPPQVEILSPADGSTFSAGFPVAFNGSVTGGRPPFTYEWTSSSDGILGNTLNLIAGVGSEVKAGMVYHPTVSLRVTDANGLVGVDTISLNINPAFWIPWVYKGP